jgi:23S rRNA (guanine745-N1)-methyltransferase
MSQMIQPHSPEWYDRLATLQNGYYYPWKSRLGDHNGESAYLSLVREHITIDKDVLDVGCGHGELTLELARSCRSILGYDRVGDYIISAQEACQREGVDNATFLHWDSSVGGTGHARLPADDDSIDLLISRRGPLHWIYDARRVTKSGAVLIQLNPMATPAPPWLEMLPQELSVNVEIRYHQPMPELVTRRLIESGLDIDSSWTFDVPEWFSTPEQLYIRLAWGFTPEEIPSFREVGPLLEKVFIEYGQPEGLAIRHRRFLWKAIV